MYWSWTTAFSTAGSRADLDLVLIDATQPWGLGHLFPRGLLREGLGGLRRAGVVILTRCDQVTLLNGAGFEKWQTGSLRACRSWRQPIGRPS